VAGFPSLRVVLLTGLRRTAFFGPPDGVFEEVGLNDGFPVFRRIFRFQGVKFFPFSPLLCSLFLTQRTQMEVTSVRSPLVNSNWSFVSFFFFWGCGVFWFFFFVGAFQRHPTSCVFLRSFSHLVASISPPNRTTKADPPPSLPSFFLISLFVEMRCPSHYVGRILGYLAIHFFHSSVEGRIPVVPCRVLCDPPFPSSWTLQTH